MKRSLSGDGDLVKMKKVKVEPDGDENCDLRGMRYFDDNVLFEVLKHADARTLAMASCVNKQWHKTAQDERLWELICTKQWANTGCVEEQLRSVVLALGGFRRLHSLYLRPLSKPYSSSSSSSSSPSPSPSPSSSSPTSSVWGPISPTPVAPRPKPLPPRLGKDAVHLSLSLLSIRFYEKMSNFNNRTR
ncbi:hypothetical protein PIB30_027915 [Stylosanthes scabra]|uniref:F-box domain-containing protein n=1 Tax=Stylosanthes scabra TaxID=79078 RepID=A0ABU6Z7K1_9FABA|nr:hypothetical protein [Stylosanthes scabra]